MVKVNAMLSDEENPNVATSKASELKSINILNAQKYHLYKLKILHERNENNPDRKLEFCVQFMELLQSTTFNAENNLFSDESKF